MPLAERRAPEQDDDTCVSGHLKFADFVGAPHPSFCLELVGMMLLPLLALSSWAALAAAKVLSLSELDWTLQNAEGMIKVPAQQPSQVHLDLKDANVITEPLLGINGKHTYWLSSRTYSGADHHLA